jgi:hypothetical protein
MKGHGFQPQKNSKEEEKLHSPRFIFTESFPLVLKFDLYFYTSIPPTRLHGTVFNYIIKYRDNFLAYFYYFEKMH